LARARADNSALGAISQGLFVSRYARAEFRPAYQVACEFSAYAEAQPESETAGRCIGQRMLAACFNLFGEFGRAAEHAERSLSYYSPMHHAPFAWRYVQDIGVSAMSQLAIALWHCGQIDRALRLGQETLSKAESLNHLHTIGYALGYSGAILAFFRGDRHSLREFAKRLRAHGEEHKMPWWAAWGVCFEAPGIASDGDADAAIAQARASIGEFDRLEARALRPIFLACLADAEILAGRPRAAIETLLEAIQISEKTREQWADAELHRLHGEALIALREVGPCSAEAAFGRAVAVARKQGSRMLELRAATDLGRLWRDTGSPNDPRALLEPILAAIGGAEKSRDVREARVLLAEFA